MAETESKILSYHGVQRLVMINSGTVDYLELDLSIPLHLNAENNIGKTSAVNTLQFLYIEAMEEMFLPKTVQESTHFYFRDEYSYLVFECVSVTGTFCVVLNRPVESRRHFVRYVIDCGYRRDLYVRDDGTPLTWPEIQASLVEQGNQVVHVANTDLWRVLAGNVDRRAAKPLPALFILPVGNQESYRRFKMIYRNLLSMSSIRIDTFKDLLLACAVASGAVRRIDFTEKEYAVRFQKCRDLQQQHDYYRLHEHEIRKLVESEKQLLQNARTLPGRCVSALHSIGPCLVAQAGEQDQARELIGEMDTELHRLQEERDTLNQQEGTITQQLSAVTKEIVEFQRLEKDEELFLLRSMGPSVEVRKKKEQLDQDFHALKNDLKSVAGLDPEFLQRQIGRDRETEENYRRILDNDQILLGRLIENGMTEEELTRLTGIFQQDLLLTPMDQVSLKKEDALIKSLKKTAESIKGPVFSNVWLKIPVNPHPVGELTDREKLQKDREQLQRQIEKNAALLQVCHEEEENIAKLNRFRKQMEQMEKGIRLLERFEELQARVPELNHDRDDLESRLLQVRQDRARNQEMQLRNGEERAETVNRLEHLTGNIQMLENERQALNRNTADTFAELPPPPSQDVKTDVDHLLDEVAQLNRLLPEFRAGTMEIRSRKDRLLRGIGLLYDREQDWLNFIEANMDVEKAGERIGKEWRTFFGLAKHDFRSLVQCVDSIGKLLKGIDATFNRQQISNLARIRVGVEANDIYRESREFTLDSDDLFADPARRQIYTTMFQQYFSGQFSDLRAEDMFNIRIDISNPANPGEDKNITSFDHESEGTNYTIKALLLSQLLKEQFQYGRYQARIHFHYYLDEIGQLDQENLANIVRQNLDKQLVPITAAPRPVIDPLCHPRCRVVTLKEHPETRRTYLADSQTFEAESLNPPVQET